MNRRQFLQSLAALGASIAIPLPALSKATTAEIDTVWQALVRDPPTFYVSSGGALSSSFGSSNSPSSRLELLDLDYPPANLAALPNYIESDWKIQRLVERLFDNAAYDGAVGTATNWSEWLTAGDEEVEYQVSSAINEWLDDDADGEDWEQADLSGMSGRGHALQFFRDECDSCDIFNIVIVEGDHPGSSYYAAELRMEVADANALAEKHGLPIRFGHDEY